VSELELPVFDHTDPSLGGKRFHEAMAELHAHGWLAQHPFGYMVMDREACEFFLRTRSAIFPGMKIAEIFGVTEGPLYEEMKRNILHVNGPDHTRLRSLVNPALSPRAVERYRPVMREFLGELLEHAIADCPSTPNDGSGPDHEIRCEFVEAFAKPYTRSACWPNTRSSGSCSRASPRSRRTPWRRRCGTSRSRPLRRASSPRR
jgi:hypothetical protein